MPLRVITTAAILLTTTASLHAQRRELYPKMEHLRSGERREWSDFPAHASGDRLQIAFHAEANEKPATLGLRRIDVKEAWRVELNGQLLGQLFSDENDMQEVWELAAGTLRNGRNELLIEGAGSRPDDVSIGEVWLDSRAREEVFGEAGLRLRAHDEAGRPLPCRFTILDQQGSLSALGAQSTDELAVRSGVVYTSTGQADIGVAAGNYTVICGRGFEYSMERVEVEAAAGDESHHAFTLRRVVNTHGLVASDPHVHTFEVSRHGDATLTERMITLAGEGIELPVAADHNTFVDYRPHLRRLGLTDVMTPIIGNEVTTKYGHFNIFPAAPDAPHPDYQAGSWEKLAASIFGIPNVRVAILNHPRDVHAGFTPFGPENLLAAVGERVDGRALPANAIELINSAALQSDPMIVFHDWLTQINRGRILTAVGTSDSHEVSRKIVGQGRSYVYVDDSDPGAIDVDAAVDGFVDGRVLVSLGLLTELTVNGRARSGDTLVAEGKTIDIAVRVQGPEWVQAEQVELYANGQRIRSAEIPDAQQSAAGVKVEVRWQLKKPVHDVHYVAVAHGAGVTSLHWPIAKPYQPTSTEWDSYTFGSSGVVRLDADGDGAWTSAREYAQQAVDSAAGELARLVAALDGYDARTAAFAAHQWVEAGGRIRGEAAERVLAAAAPAVQQGFETYARSQRETLRAQSR